MIKKHTSATTNEFEIETHQLKHVNHEQTTTDLSRGRRARGLCCAYVANFSLLSR